jgi:hypothetical protein
MISLKPIPIKKLVSKFWSRKQSLALVNPVNFTCEKSTYERKREIPQVFQLSGNYRQPGSAKEQDIFWLEPFISST